LTNNPASRIDMARGDKTGTLYDYPTYTLKNLAKEYNIHYYIKDIERLSKADLVEAILAHVEWLKTPEAVKNKIQFEKSLKDAPTNFEKNDSGFYKEKPGRMNIKQIEKGLEKKEEKPPTPPTPPAYKGQKGVSKKVATLVEAVVKETTSQAKLLADYHALSAADQAAFRDVIGIEAKPLPKGVPALGEADVSDRQIAIAINDYQEENAPGIVQLQEPATLQAPPPKRKIKIKSSQVKEDEHPKLTEFEAKAANDGEHSQRRMLIAIAKLLIQDKKISQGKIGHALREQGFEAGTAQPSISKKISYMTQIGLIKPYSRENPYPIIA